MGSKFIDESLKAHNEYRKMHGSPPLTINKDITAIAQRYAEQIAKADKFAHSAPDKRQYKGETLGENLAMKWSSKNDEFTGDQATEQWYDEIQMYNFKTHTGEGTGHFTQVVWKGSSEMGIGKAQTKGGKWFVVANYYPAGNYVGRHPENVLPVGGGISSGAGTSGGSIGKQSEAGKPSKVSTTTSKAPDVPI